MATATSQEITVEQNQNNQNAKKEIKTSSVLTIYGTANTKYSENQTALYKAQYHDHITIYEGDNLYKSISNSTIPYSVYKALSTTKNCPLLLKSISYQKIETNNLNDSIKIGRLFKLAYNAMQNDADKLFENIQDDLSQITNTTDHIILKSLCYKHMFINEFNLTPDNTIKFNHIRGEQIKTSEGILCFTITLLLTRQSSLNTFNKKITRLLTSTDSLTIIERKILEDMKSANIAQIEEIENLKEVIKFYALIYSTSIKMIDDMEKHLNQTYEGKRDKFLKDKENYISISNEANFNIKLHKKLFPKDSGFEFSSSNLYTFIADYYQLLLNLIYDKGSEYIGLRDLHDQLMGYRPSSHINFSTPSKLIIFQTRQHHNKLVALSTQCRKDLHTFASSIMERDLHSENENCKEFLQSTEIDIKLLNKIKQDALKLKLAEAKSLQSLKRLVNLSFQSNIIEFKIALEIKKSVHMINNCILNSIDKTLDKAMKDAESNNYNEWIEYDKDTVYKIRDMLISLRNKDISSTLKQNIEKLFTKFVKNIGRKSLSISDATSWLETNTPVNENQKLTERSVNAIYNIILDEYKKLSENDNFTEKSINKIYMKIKSIFSLIEKRGRHLICINNYIMKGINAIIQNSDLAPNLVKSISAKLDNLLNKKINISFENKLVNIINLHFTLDVILNTSKDIKSIKDLFDKLKSFLSQINESDLIDSIDKEKLISDLKTIDLKSLLNYARHIICELEKEIPNLVLRKDNENSIDYDDPYYTDKMDHMYYLRYDLHNILDRIPLLAEVYYQDKIPSDISTLKNKLSSNIPEKSYYKYPDDLISTIDLMLVRKPTIPKLKECITEILVLYAGDKSNDEKQKMNSAVFLKNILKLQYISVFLIISDEITDLETLDFINEKIFNHENLPVINNILRDFYKNTLFQSKSFFDKDITNKCLMIKKTIQDMESNAKKASLSLLKSYDQKYDIKLYEQAAIIESVDLNASKLAEYKNHLEKMTAKFNLIKTELSSLSFDITSLQKLKENLSLLYKLILEDIPHFMFTDIQHEYKLTISKQKIRLTENKTLGKDQTITDENHTRFTRKECISFDGDNKLKDDVITTLNNTDYQQATAKAELNKNHATWMHNILSPILYHIANIHDISLTTSVVHEQNIPVANELISPFAKRTPEVSLNVTSSIPKNKSTSNDTTIKVHVKYNISYSDVIHRGYNYQLLFSNRLSSLNTQSLTTVAFQRKYCYDMIGESDKNDMTTSSPLYLALHPLKEKEFKFLIEKKLNHLQEEMLKILQDEEEGLKILQDEEEGLKIVEDEEEEEMLKIVQDEKETMLKILQEEEEKEKALKVFQEKEEKLNLKDLKKIIDEKASNNLDKLLKPYELFLPAAEATLFLVQTENKHFSTDNSEEKSPRFISEPEDTDLESLPEFERSLSYNVAIDRSPFKVDILNPKNTTKTLEAANIVEPLEEHAL